MQETCEVSVTSPSYTDCEHERWGPIEFQFEPNEANVVLLMSAVCNKTDTVSFEVDIKKVKNVDEGYLKLIQHSTGPQEALPISAEWFIEKISISCKNKSPATFRIGRMVDTDRIYDFSNFDTNIKHDGCEWDQGVQEIAMKRSLYKRARLFGDGPYMVSLVQSFICKSILYFLNPFMYKL